MYVSAHTHTRTRGMTEKTGIHMWGINVPGSQDMAWASHADFHFISSQSTCAQGLLISNIQAHAGNPLVQPSLEKRIFWNQVSKYRKSVPLKSGSKATATQEARGECSWLPIKKLSLNARPHWWVTLDNKTLPYTTNTLWKSLWHLLLGRNEFNWILVPQQEVKMISMKQCVICFVFIWNKGWGARQK